METQLDFVEVAHGAKVLPVVVGNEGEQSTDTLCRNIEHNVLRPIPRFIDSINLKKKRSRPLAIMAGGPSLLTTIQYARRFRQFMACGSAFDYLVGKGIRPHWAVLADAFDGAADFMTRADFQTTYLVASHCHPVLFDFLAPFDNTQLWHLRLDVEADRRGELMISWGGNVTVMAIHLAILLGFRDLHFFGFDSCYSNDTDTHCYPMDTQWSQEKFTVDIGHRRMLTDGKMLLQAENFFKILSMESEYFHATIHGDGLIAEMVRQGDPGLSKYVTLV